MLDSTVYHVIFRMMELESTSNNKLLGHCFEIISVLLFVVRLSDYDCVTEKDGMVLARCPLSVTRCTHKYVHTHTHTHTCAHTHRK